MTLQNFAEYGTRAIQESIEAADQGDLMPHDQVMDEMDDLIDDLARISTI